MTEVTQKNAPMKIRYAVSDRIFYALSFIITTLLLIIVALPLVYIVSSSISDGVAVTSGRVILWPVGFSLEGYTTVFKYPHILTGYKNTIIYTVFGTLINVFVTLIAAYPLTRKTLPGRNFFTFLFAFTMWFSGGMIPFYILMRDLRFINTIWVMIVPGALSVYNMILCRTFIQASIPNDLLEAAQIDGCSDFKYFYAVVLPLSKAVIAVITLFFAVGHWNAYFNGFLYLTDRNKMPLQVLLREILVRNVINMNDIQDPELAASKAGLAELLKYSLIVFATVPVMCLYPFVQKYFVTGVMLGSIKG